MALGSVLFGHFEQGTPAWRRVLKLAVFLGVTALLSGTAGRTWAFVFLGALAVAGTSVHFWWCRRHSIDPWTAEPRDRFHELVGWGTSEGAQPRSPKGRWEVLSAPPDRKERR